MWNSEKFIIVRERVTVEREYMVRVTDGNSAIASVESLDGNQEYIDASDKDIAGTSKLTKVELRDDWQSDPVLLKYARFIMDNMGLLDEPEPIVKKRRKRRAIVQGSPKIERDSLDNAEESDIMTPQDYCEFAKEISQ